MLSGSAASRSTPNGLSVSVADLAHLLADARPVLAAAMPSVPKPPASETAAHTSA